MKNSILFLCALLFICCQEDKEVFKEQLSHNLKTNPKFSTEFFLKKDTVIKSDLGTSIEIPKDLFDNYTGGIIALEFKEYYTKNEIVLNGLSTITNKGELLESSGMFYINFKENGEQLEIKEGKKYKIFPINDILEKSDIYYNDNDSIFNWALSQEKIEVEIEDLLGFYYFIQKNKVDGTSQKFTKKVLFQDVAQIKKVDSLKYFELLKRDERKNLSKTQTIESDIFESFPIILGNENGNENRDIENDTKLTKQEKVEKIKQRDNFYDKTKEVISFTNSQLGWINIDRLAKFSKDVKLQIQLKNHEDLTNISIYYIYLDQFSFYKELFLSQSSYDRNFRVSGSTKVVVVSNNSKNSYLYDVFYVNENSKTNFNIDLKEISLDKLKQVLISR